MRALAERSNRRIETDARSVVRLRRFYGIKGNAVDIEAELPRYTRLFEGYQSVACVLGIGQNGHRAFDDARLDFNTAKIIDVVALDQTARQQQVR